MPPAGRSPESKSTQKAKVCLNCSIDLPYARKVDVLLMIAEIKAANAKTYAEGTGDRVQGKVNSVVGAVTGDTSQQTKVSQGR